MRGVRSKGLTLPNESRDLSHRIKKQASKIFGLVAEFRESHVAVSLVYYDIDIPGPNPIGHILAKRGVGSCAANICFGVT